MVWKVIVSNREGIFDAFGEGIKKDITDLGISDVQEVKVSQVYILEGDIDEKDIRQIAEGLLRDSITQEYKIDASLQIEDAIIEVAYNPGVMDPWEESIRKGIRDLGIAAPEKVKTRKRYLIRGNLKENEIAAICEKLLANKVIQHTVRGREEIKVPSSDYKFRLMEVDILSAEETKLAEISKKGQLFLNLAEMQAIQKHFSHLKRNPTDAELETIAQTWSEHCGHKTFRGLIEYKDKSPSPQIKSQTIDNLLKFTIMKVTDELNRPWCVSVFKDNAGVIRFDEDYNICFKVETHNHPSALEPYGGAGTGIGGVIRDPLGTGLGAKPIINTDVFCFGPPDTPFDKLPPGTLHPKRIMKGVVAGVRDYGNRMGIPTSNGAVLFDSRYVGNPLVYCGNVGIMPKHKSFKKVKPGRVVVLIGGKTGRDGIHGATFSSGELTQESEVISGGAVQIGNPITEKKFTDTLLEARDKGLYEAVTDCGGGGLSSAVGEMGEDTGVRVDLDKVPLKYKGLSYTEIWISEAQERMILAVPRDKLEELLAVFAREDVEATVIGEFTSDKKLNLQYKGETVCNLDMHFLHKGVPRITREAVWEKKSYAEPEFPCPRDLTDALKKILASGNVCSKEWVIRQYDHEVQGGSVLKPLVGVHNDGPGDASVTRPRLDSLKGVIISNGINPKYGDIDPYWMAASNIDEALRQIIAVGGNLERVALLDNFSWGNTNKPDRLGGLVRAAWACYDMARVYGTPFISGKDSLNNEYRVGKETVSIPGTLLISAIAVVDDVTKTISMDVKEAGNLIYVVGTTFDELGGSHYYELQGHMGNSVPQVDAIKGKKTMRALAKATSKGLVRACHDLSEGGLGVACAEMAFAGAWGMEIFLKEVPFESVAGRRSPVTRNDTVLFSESNTRFIVEVAKKNQKTFEKIMQGISWGLIGCVSAGKDFKVYGLEGEVVVSASIDELKECWQSPLRW